MSYLVGPETPRLLHRAFTPDDAEAVLDFNSNPKVMKYTGEPLWTSLEQTKERLASYPDFEVYGFGRWGCVHKADNRVIGFSGFKYIPELDEVDLGYRLLPEYWNQGLATESCRACVQYGFEVMRLKRIIALIVPENAASIRVVEKVGLLNQGKIEFDGETAYRFEIEPT